MKRTWLFVGGPVFYLSLLTNAMTGGSIHETASARVGYAAQRGNKVARITCAVFNKFDMRWWIPRTHCEEAIHKDLERRLKHGRQTDGNGHYF